MIDEEKTYREKGYRSTDLSPGSKRDVWMVCDNPYCEGEEREGVWKQFRLRMDLCQKCAVGNRHMSKNEDQSEKLPWIDDDITFAEKGYMSTWLKYGSNKPVWAICANPDCEREGGRGRWVQFRACTEFCITCACRTEESRKNRSDSHKGNVHSDETKLLMSENHADVSGENSPFWKGGIYIDEYCKLFNKPMKDVIRNYFDNICFKCGRTIDQNIGRKMSVHHINYQKDCGCDNTQFCVYVPLCMKCHGESNHNRWYWYNRFMTELALRNPNYYAYHIPVVYYDEPCYNYSYVFEKQRRDL